MLENFSVYDWQHHRVCKANIAIHPMDLNAWSLSQDKDYIKVCEIESLYINTFFPTITYNVSDMSGLKSTNIMPMNTASMPEYLYLASSGRWIDWAISINTPFRIKHNPVKNMYIRNNHLKLFFLVLRAFFMKTNEKWRLFFLLFSCPKIQ